jgi:HK97 family phage portal protein
MGALTRLVRPRAETVTEAMQRIFRGAGARSTAGVAVTADSALLVATVFACVRVISEDVAKLPLMLHRRLPGGGREQATDHPLYAKLHDRPNGWQTSYEWREFMQGCVELRGNGYSLITRVGTQVGELIPLHPARVTAVQDERYRVSYRVEGMEDPVPADRMLHIPGLSFNGLTGHNPLSVAGGAIGLALATQQHGGRVFSNGAHLRGILKHPTKFKDKEAADRVKESWDAAANGTNAFRTAVLEEGMSWESVGMTNEDSQFLETRRFQRSDIATYWRVPPHKVGIMDNATFTNIEHQAQEYVVDALLSRLVRWEQRLNNTLLSPAERRDHYFEFLLEGLLRGDFKTRTEGYRNAVMTGWMNRNEARIRENMNPAPGLDAFYEPLNMAHAGDEPGKEKNA